MRINGTSGNDSLVGTSGRDIFNLSQGGDDTADGLGGNDIFRMSASFSLYIGDKLIGGEGHDTLVLDGNHFGFEFEAETISGIETIRFASGHLYDLTLHDGNVAAGEVLEIDASKLTSSDNLALDLSAETDGRFVIRPGGAAGPIRTGAGDDVFHLEHGSNSDVSGDAGDDRFFFGTTFSGSDKVDGGDGFDTIFIEHNSGGTLTQLWEVEEIRLTGGYSYAFGVADSVVAAGATLIVDASDLSAGNNMQFQGQQELDGRFHFIGGAGRNLASGGFGNDRFDLRRGSVEAQVSGGRGKDTVLLDAEGHGWVDVTFVVDSTSTAYDVVRGVNFDDATVFTGMSPASVAATVTSGALSKVTFDNDLAVAVGADELAVGAAVIFEPDSGSLANHAFLIVESNGSAGYQASSDRVIEITGYIGTLDTSDFF